LLGARPWRSGRLLLVQRGSVGDADDQPIVGEKPGHRLSPRLGAGWMPQLKTCALKLGARRGDVVCQDIPMTSADAKAAILAGMEGSAPIRCPARRQPATGRS